MSGEESHGLFLQLHKTLLPFKCSAAISFGTLSGSILLAHAHAWPSLDSSKPVPKELEVSGSGSGTVGTEAQSF